VTATEPPAGLTHALAGLWWDAKGDWKRAHESAERDEGKDGSWVHAYLHRKEGDQGNASYWYNRAGKPVCREPLDVEWLSIAAALLGQAARHRSRTLDSVAEEIISQTDGRWFVRQPTTGMFPSIASPEC
jgi:hypothetical protein